MFLIGCFVGAGVAGLFFSLIEPYDPLRRRLANWFAMAMFLIAMLIGLSVLVSRAA